jgi:hypothetical protein
VARSAFDRMAGGMHLPQPVMVAFRNSPVR